MQRGERGQGREREPPQQITGACSHGPRLGRRRQRLDRVREPRRGGHIRAEGADEAGHELRRQRIAAAVADERVGRGRDMLVQTP